MSFIEKLIYSIVGDDEKTTDNQEKQIFQDDKIDGKKILINKNKNIIVINEGDLQIEQPKYINVKNIDVELLIENDKLNIDKLNEEFDKILNEEEEEDESNNGEFREIEKEKFKKKQIKKEKKKNSKKKSTKGTKGLKSWYKTTRKHSIIKDIRRWKKKYLIKMQWVRLALSYKKLKLRRKQEKLLAQKMLINGRAIKISKKMLKTLMKLCGKKMAVKIILLLYKTKKLNSKNLKKIIKKLKKLRKKLMVRQTTIVKTIKKQINKNKSPVNKIKKIIKDKQKKIELEKKEKIVEQKTRDQKNKIAKLYAVLNKRQMAGKVTKTLEARISYEQQVLNKQNMFLSKIQNKKNKLTRSL